MRCLMGIVYRFTETCSDRRPVRSSSPPSWDPALRHSLHLSHQTSSAALRIQGWKGKPSPKKNTLIKNEKDTPQSVFLLTVFFSIFKSTGNVTDCRNVLGLNLKCTLFLVIIWIKSRNILGFKRFKKQFF